MILGNDYRHTAEGGKITYESGEDGTNAAGKDVNFYKYVDWHKRGRLQKLLIKINPETAGAFFAPRTLHIADWDNDHCPGRRTPNPGQ